MRKLGIAIVVVIVLVVMAALILPHFLDVNSYRKTVPGSTPAETRASCDSGRDETQLAATQRARGECGNRGRSGGRTGKPVALVQELYVSVNCFPAREEHRDQQLGNAASTDRDGEKREREMEFLYARSTRSAAGAGTAATATAFAATANAVNTATG